ncbi:MAG: amidohydrolase family protein, partial [Methanobacteriota archaeon]
MRLDADYLIVGDGELIKDGSVVVKEDRIIYAGENEHAPKEQEVQVVHTLMPGLWECHGHFIGIEKLDFNQEFFTHPFHQAMRT